MILWAKGSFIRTNIVSKIEQFCLFYIKYFFYHNWLSFEFVFIINHQILKWVRLSWKNMSCAHACNRQDYAIFESKFVFIFINTSKFMSQSIKRVDHRRRENVVVTDVCLCCLAKLNSLKAKPHPDWRSRLPHILSVNK